MNTKTVQIHGYIVFDTMRARHPDIWPDGGFCFQCYESSDKDQVLVREEVLTLEVPADFDPRPGMVVALEKEKLRLRAEFAASVINIDRQINELLAIECSGVAA